MDHEIKRHLITIGNHLRNGELVERAGSEESPDEKDPEQYEVCFSREDKLHWESITPLFYELPTSYLLNFLAQYLDRLEKICDNEALEALGFYDDPDVIAIYEVDENGSLQIKLNAPIDKENFKSYVQVLKNHGFKFEPTKKSWYLPFGQRGQLDLLSYVRELDQLGITSFPLPSAELDLSSIDKVISAIHSNELRDCIALKCFDDGKFSFYFALSSQLNMFFSNKSGILTGITEYNPEGHGRETYDLPFVEEILAKIKVHLPEYTVYLDEKLKDRIKKHQHYVEELKKPIPELVTKMADHITLFPYQNEGVRFLEKTGGNALIGDEMGLGKTIQALAWVAMKGKRALAIVPKVVILA